MRKYLKWGVALVLVNLALVSCEQDNETEGARIDKPVLSLEGTNTFSAVEGDEVTFTLTTDRPISQDVQFKIQVANDESTASFRDFMSTGSETDIAQGGFNHGQIGYDMVFPAYATSQSYTITIDKDLLIEGNETLVLSIVSSGNGLGLIAPESSEIIVNIADYVSNDIAIRLDWGGDTASDFGTIVPGSFSDDEGDSYLFADEFDFDIYVFDMDFNEVSGYAAATGAQPENAVLLNDDLADGEYTIIVDLYDKGTTPTVPVNIPVNLTVSKFGVWSQTIAISEYTSDHATSAANGGLGDGYIIAATLVKSGTTYTLYSGEGTTGTVLASGRMSQLSNLIAGHKKHN